MDANNTEMSEGEALLVRLLEQLWQMAREAPARPCSLARVSKRSGFPMSALIRQLSLLADAGLVEVAAREEGGGSVALTASGKELCGSWFGA